MTHKVDSRSLFGSKGGGISAFVRAGTKDIAFRREQREAKLKHEGSSSVPTSFARPVAANRGILENFMRGGIRP